LTVWPNTARASPKRMLTGKTVIVGISGGIAAYKTCEIVRGLKKEGAEVFCVMTVSAQKFVSPLTFRTLSGNPVITDLFDEDLNNTPVPHIALREKADLVLVAPATANIIGKTANGLADDALSTLLLSVKCPVIFAPAMNPVMWENKVVRQNSKKIQKLGIKLIGPVYGEVACGEEGTGRMAEVSSVIDAVFDLLNHKNDLSGLKILITAGATREAIDPIRFISNRSSGKMGFALAHAAKRRGAEVTLISGPTYLNPPANVNLIEVTSAEEMHKAVQAAAQKQDVIIMTAAVADYRPNFTFMQKLQKRADTMSLELTRTVDILEELGKSKNGSFLVGFAAESNNLIENAREKMKKKNLDLIVANNVEAFEEDCSEVFILDKAGEVEQLPLQEKISTANSILDRIVTRVSPSRKDRA